MIASLIRKSMAFVGLMAFLAAAVAEDVPRDEAGFTGFVANHVRNQLSDAEIDQIIFYLDHMAGRHRATP